MSKRIFQHALFWLLYILSYAVLSLLFAGPSDLAYPPVQRFFRFLLSELIFLPWKVIPFYFLFYYLIPRYFQRGRYFTFGLMFSGMLIICIFGYRTMITPLSDLLYNETPSFQVYSIERLLYTLTDILPALAIAATVKLLKGRVAFQQKEANLRREKQQAELNFLKAQTNPHFLFNTLNNLYGLARRNDRQTAPSILKLSSIMRYILQECSAPAIPLSSEIRIIEDYIELERLRYNDRLQVEFDRSIDQPEYPIAPLILLPFVENAFKHGAGEARFDIEIRIALVLSRGQLQFHISNTTDQDHGTDLKKGTGLQNVSRQLELIYGDHYQLDIRPEAGIFSVHLNVDLQQNEGRSQT